MNTTNAVPNSENICSKQGSKDSLCCKVEALISMDARGQIVLPKSVREKAGIEAGDKLALIGFQSGDRIFCISLIKTDSFAETIKGTLEPMLAAVLTE